MFLSQVVICGAGDWGYLAYWDYCKGSDVLAFVDINNRYKKDIVKTNVQVQSIDYLSTVSKSTQIVVAIENPDERNHAISTMLSLGFSLFKVYSPPVGLNEAEYIKKVSLDRAVSVLKELTDNRSINLSEFLLNETRGGGAFFLKELTFMPGGSGIFDYALLYSIARMYNCKKYLEIGTYIGESINILTDICDELHSITAKPGEPYSMRNWCKNRNIPDYSERLTYSPKIVHHYGDSKTFDYNRIPQDIDLYFIDGDHSFFGVYFDTLNIFKYRKPDSIVVWHDFKNADSQIINEVAWAVKTALSPEDWKNVFCFDMNMCGIYLPINLQRDFTFSQKLEYTESPQDLFCYDITFSVHKR